MIVKAGRVAAIVGLSLALAVNCALLRDLTWIPDLEVMNAEAASREQLRATTAVTLDELLTLIDEGAIVIDARPASAFDEAHLAAAQTVVLNVPADEFDLHLPRLRELEGSRFVLYCSSEACNSAEELYLAMVDVGFDPADLFVYFPGWDGIVAARLQTATGVEAPASDLILE